MTEQQGSDGLRRICVFCGSNPGNDPAYREAAEALGRLFAARGIGLVYGGGRVGMMGRSPGGSSCRGVAIRCPRGLQRKGWLRRLTDDRHPNMHEHKQRMADLADGFIALPGGFGTFEEFCEIVTWAQLGLHEKPCGLLNVKGYYTPLLALFDHALAEGFLKPQYRSSSHRGEPQPCRGEAEPAPVLRSG
jgi:uncharacterized protein (TIGR00730 family)